MYALYSAVLGVGLLAYLPAFLARRRRAGYGRDVAQRLGRLGETRSRRQDVVVTVRHVREQLPPGLPEEPLHAVSRNGRADRAWHGEAEPKEQPEGDFDRRADAERERERPDADRAAHHKADRGHPDLQDRPGDADPSPGAPCANDHQRVARAGAEPCRDRGSWGASATARNGLAFSCSFACRYRFNHPSRVLFTPGVPLSM